MGAFGAGLQEGAARRDYREQQSDALKQQQRAAKAALYWNAVQTELPPSTVKDAQGNQVKNPAYDEALQKREDALKSYIYYLGPEQHASIGNRLHGLIFGEPAQPVHGNAPQPAPAPAGGPPAPSGAPQPQSSHPFAANPVYAKIHEGLDALGNRLKGFAHPLPPQPETDWASLASAMTPEQRQSAQAAELERMKEEAALEREQILAGSRNLSTPEKQFLSRWAISHGATDFESLPSDQQEAAMGEWHRSTANPIFKVSGATGLMSRVTYAPDGTPIMTPVLDTNGKPFGGLKPGSVTLRDHFFHWTDADGNIHQLRETEETTRMMRPYMAPDSAQPKAPVSSQAPQLPSGEKPLNPYLRNPEDQPPQISFAFNRQWAKPGPYSTKLNPQQEQEFRKWAAANPKAVSGEVGPAPEFAPLPMADYDVRGHWLAAKNGDPVASLTVSTFDGKLHGNDKFKTPYDGTFSNESMYALPTAPHWEKDKLVTADGRLVSDESPGLGKVNAKIATANAASPKLHKKQKPRSATAPQYGQGRVIGHTASLMDKAAIAAYVKNMPVLNATESAIKAYVDGGQYDGPGDLALQHEFFTATQPATGFRMTKVQQDILANARSWIQSNEAKALHAATGRWFTTEQIKQMANAALDAIAAKKQAYKDLLSNSSNPDTTGNNSQVRMRAPDGTIKDVPAYKVKLFESQGATVVE